MNKKNKSFKEPDNVNIKIYRYLNFSNFVYLLEKKKLYFPSAEELSKIDEFEGKVPKKFEHKFRDEIWDENFLRNICISCWHMNEGESDAMWKLYSTYVDGVAIQSTFKQLKESFNKSTKSIYYSKVKYIDHEIWEWNDLPFTVCVPFRLKNISFEHEKELRAFAFHEDLLNFGVKTGTEMVFKYHLKTFIEKLCLLINNIYLGKNVDAEVEEIKKLFETTIIQPKEIKMRLYKLIGSDTASHTLDAGGIYIDVEPDILIEKIYISPGAKPWFDELVKSTLKNYNLNTKEVKKSKLAKLHKI